MKVKIKDKQSDIISNFGLVGQTKEIRKVLKRLKKCAREDVTVLITGETGTGKEKVARAIHALSDRADGPFVAVNMGAMAGDIVPSEIFGHVKGSFTGASESREGLFQTAENGTLFLDEIGSMDYKLQTILLRILEGRVFRKVGGSKDQKTNARIIAASNSDLRVAVQEKRFRRDLLYRLEVFPIHVPSLRERREDIPLLSEFFLNQFSDELQTVSVKGFSNDALDCFLNYSWPGNVRELKSVVQSSMITAEGSVITIEDLPSRICLEKRDDKASIVPGLTLKEVEKRYIMQTLKQKKGNKSQTAKTLGVSRRYLYNKLDEYESAMK